jgi:uncharacterized membrane protein YfcA
MEALSLDIILVLSAIAALAGFIDAIAGGGGLITVPALLCAGVPPLNALATNKLQGCFGSGTASYRFWRKGHINLSELFWPVALTFIGAALGTWTVQHIHNDWLNQIIPILLIGVALYFALSPSLKDLDGQQRISIGAFGLSGGLIVGFYDGFFGPGTGSFFFATIILLLGWGAKRATGSTKLLNFTSNIASLVFFAAGGQVFWALGLAMGAGQIIGAWLGSHLAIKHGAKLIKPLVVVISIALSIKLLID